MKIYILYNYSLRIYKFIYHNQSTKIECECFRHKINDKIHINFVEITKNRFSMFYDNFFS